MTSQKNYIQKQQPLGSFCERNSDPRVPRTEGSTSSSLSASFSSQMFEPPTPLRFTIPKIGHGKGNAALEIMRRKQEEEDLKASYAAPSEHLTSRCIRI